MVKQRTTETQPETWDCTLCGDTLTSVGVYSAEFSMSYLNTIQKPDSESLTSSRALKLIE